MFGAAGSSMSGKLGGYNLPRWGQSRTPEEMQAFQNEANADYSNMNGSGMPLNSGFGVPGTDSSSGVDASQFSPENASRFSAPPQFSPDLGGRTVGTTTEASNTPNPNHPGDTSTATVPSSTPQGLSNATAPAVNWQTPGWVGGLSPLDQQSVKTISGQTNPYTLGRNGLNPLSAGFWE